MRYIAVAEDLVARVVYSGPSHEETMARELSEPYDAWLAGGMALWKANVHVLFQRLTGDARAEGQ